MSDKHELSHQLVRRQLDVVKDEARQGSEQERQSEQGRERGSGSGKEKRKSKTQP